jgi:fucose 4-O-acetylase-like acetyltransferase
MAYNKTSKRIFELDIARVIGMYLVVFGHLYDGDSPIRMWIYSFHMPLFFFVSGILHKERASFNASVAHFAKALLLPTVVFGVVYLVLFIPLTYFNISLYNDFATPPVDNHLPFIGYMVAMLKFVVLDALLSHSLPDGVIWFLVTLFYCKVWTLLLDRRPLLIGICYLLLFYVCFKYNANLLFVKQSLMALPFYVIGYKFKNKILAAIHHYNSWTLAILFLVLNIALIFINGRSSMFSCLFGTKLNIYFSIILFYFNSFCGISFIMLMSTKLMGGGRMVFKDLKFSDLCSGSPGVHTEYIPQICG